MTAQAISTSVSPHTDHGSQATRMLILPASSPGALLSCVRGVTTVPLYRTIVSRTLREALRKRSFGPQMSYLSDRRSLERYTAPGTGLSRCSPHGRLRGTPVVAGM